MIENLYSATKDDIKKLCIEREKYWIKYYKDIGCNLYNMTDGGDDVLEKKYPERAVIQYDLFCNELARYNSMAEASDITGINHSDISECCLKRGKIYSTDNYIWRYIDDPLSDAEILELNNRYKGVCQYDFDGNLLNTFYRPKDAEKYFKSLNINIDDANISACMYGKVKSAAGYIWRFRFDDFNKYPLPKVIKKVNQYTLNGEYIATYDNCVDAENHTNVDASCINLCCLKKHQYAGGFLWCYDGDNINTNIKIKKHAVKQYDLQKNYIATYQSIKEAAMAVHTSRSGIGAVCNNRNKTASGYIWRYENDDIDTYQYA